MFQLTCDPETGQWNAPGLGNNLNSIHRDQERRMFAVLRAIALHTGQAPPSRKVIFPIAGQTMGTAKLSSSRAPLAESLMRRSR